MLVWGPLEDYPTPNVLIQTKYINVAFFPGKKCFENELCFSGAKWFEHGKEADETTKLPGNFTWSPNAASPRDVGWNRSWHHKWGFLYCM